MLASLEAARAGERRFLADASHELRTPVTTLLGNVEYAARHGADPEVLEELQRDARRLARLVDDLLALERADAGVSSEGEVDLGEVVRGVVGAHRARTPAGSDRPESITRWSGETERALARAREPGRERVGARPRRAAGSRSSSHALTGGRSSPSGTRDPGRIRTTATGCSSGSGAGAGASGRPGSGLGLSIVSAIVDRHGGRVVVDGSAFTLDLPAKGGD